MKIEVLSLGGSLIVPDEVNYKFLNNFRGLISKFRDRRFVIVVGGGGIARKYMRGLKNLGFGVRDISSAGAKVNNLNAWFMERVFRGLAAQKLPKNMGDISGLLRKKKVIFLGVLKLEKGHTSDATAAEIANHFKTRFINITNVNGLYNKDPRKSRNARLIKHASFKKFYKIANKMKYEPGQHFVLDQLGAKIIMKHRIRTFIVGHNLRNLENLLRGKRFVGTTIYG